jgi:hypothetical protein
MCAVCQRASAEGRVAKVNCILGDIVLSGASACRAQSKDRFQRYLIYPCYVHSPAVAPGAFRERGEAL